jgi:hypothetical protein
MCLCSLQQTTLVSVYRVKRFVSTDFIDSSKELTFCVKTEDEAVGCLETPVNFCRTARCLIPEDNNFHSHRGWILKSHRHGKKVTIFLNILCSKSVIANAQP